MEGIGAQHTTRPKSKHNHICSIWTINQLCMSKAKGEEEKEEKDDFIHHLCLPETQKKTKETNIKAMPL